jgi:hypothetical protein
LKFKFDLNSHGFVIYKTVCKKKNVVLFEFGFWAESSARPTWPPRAQASCVAQRFAGTHPHSEPNLTR